MSTARPPHPHISFKPSKVEVGLMAHAVPIALTGADQAAYTGTGHYFGFSMRETAGSSATAKIYDGTTATGTLLDTVSLAAGESAREWYGPQGIYIKTGIYVDVGGSGTIEGSVRVG